MKSWSARVMALAAIAGSTAATAQGGGIAKSIEGLPVKGIQNVAITVSDIDATIAFYSKAVPYKLHTRFTVLGSVFGKGLLANRHSTVEIAIIEMPTMFIQLMDFEPGKRAAPDVRPVIGPGYTHICFQSPSTDSAYRKFREAGLDPVSRGGSEGVDIGGYGVHYAYGRDPDGIMIENEILDKPKRSEAAWVTHVANVVHNRDTMLGFYAKLLERPPHRKIDQENRPRLDDIANIDNIAIKGGWFSVGNMEIEVWQFARPQTPAPTGDRKLDSIGYNAIGFEVADLAVERTRLKKLGVRLAGSVVRVGAWKIQYAYDPEGNLFAMQQNVGGNLNDSVDHLDWIARPKAN